MIDDYENERILQSHYETVIKIIKSIDADDNYVYLDDRLRIRVTENASISRFDIFIAWITMDNIEKEEIYTWFAADPTAE